MSIPRLSAIFLTLTSAVVGFSPGAGAIEPREVSIGESTSAHPCGISRDGSTVVFQEKDGDGWARWTSQGRLESIGGSAPSTSDVHVSDDGRYLTQWFDNAGIRQLDATTGRTTDLLEFRPIVSRPAVSPTGGQVTWFELRSGEVGAPTFVGVRQWNRASGRVTTLVDVTNEGWVGGGSRAVSANGRFLALPMSPQSERFTSVQVVDTIDRMRFAVRRPGGLEFGDLLGISDDGRRFFWLDESTHQFANDRWIVADRAGVVQSEITIGHTMSFDGQFQHLLGEYHFATDGSEVVAIGARPDPSQRRGDGVAYRWRVGGQLETVETSSVVSGTEQQFSPSPRLSSSWCDVSADLRFVVVVDPTASPPVSVSLADLDRVAPRRIDPSEVSGPQLSDQMSRLYAAFFDRSPDAQGLDFWLKRRASGTSLAAVANQFVRSDEFIQTYGPLDDEAFVRRVYANVLDRSPDAGGLAFWTARLAAGTTRGSLMIGFSESPEFITQTATTTPVFDPRVASISRLYRAFFDRLGDSGGLTFWFDEISTGRANLRQIASGFVQSAEFASTYGNVDDGRFVDLVYANVLGRTPDPAGRSYWLGQLGAGRSRGDMMIGFSESPEFIAATNTIPVRG